LRNNTIALLVGVLIVISIASILIAPGKIFYITGGATTGTSSAAVNLTEEVSILVTGALDFRSGRVDPNVSNAVIDSSLGKYNYTLVNISSEISGAVPSPRYGLMAYDNDRKIMVLFGGFYWNGSSMIYYNDTWEFNYSSKEWTNITTADIANAHPGGPIVYDSLAKKVIMIANGGTEVWEYNGINWTKRNPSSYPSPRGDFGIVFDSKRNVTVLFGGHIDNVGEISETWEYNYSLDSWVNVTTNNSPPAVKNVGLAFDSKRGKVVMFGGESAATFFNETWEYDGTDWTNVTGSQAPHGRSYPPMVYDSLRDKVVLFGGYPDDTSSYTYEDEIWDYDPDDHSWHLIRDVTIPNHQISQALAFDSYHNVTIIFGGLTNALSSTAYSNTTLVYNYSLSGGMVNGSWFPYKDYLSIENDGTVNISVNYTADKNAAQFIGGTNPSFQIKGVVDEIDACPDLNTTYADVPNSTQAPNVLCPILKYQNNADLFKVASRIVVPSDVPPGVHTSTITFTASKV